MAFSAYFDAHCDTLLQLASRGGELYSNDYHISLDKTASFPHYAQVFAIFSDACPILRQDCRSEDELLERIYYGEYSLEFDRCRRCYELEKDALDRALADPENDLTLCLSADDIERTWARGGRAAVLSAEGHEQIMAIGLDRAYLDGVRIVTLTWNYGNLLGGSCITGEGLTDEGRKFVREANEKGILLDVSHGSDALFYDVIAESSAPILASHSNSRAVHSHRRNLTDEQFLALIKNGGAAGINLYSEFICSGECDTKSVIRHIDHYFSLGGEDHVCLGTDFDGCSSLPKDIGDVGDMPRLAEALSKAGYTDEQIDKIFYKNLLRVFREAVSK